MIQSKSAARTFVLLISALALVFIAYFAYHNAMHPTVFSAMMGHNSFVLLMLSALILIFIDTLYWRLLDKPEKSSWQKLLYLKPFRMAFWSCVGIWLLTFLSVYCVSLY